jgi:fructokinase
MAHGFTIVGIGEALFDVFPGHNRLGGAPLNAAVHAHRFGTHLGGGRGVVVSRVGQDPLGNELLKHLQDRGMTVEYIQTDPDRPTGRVYVDTDFAGQPTYDIIADTAYDNLQFDFDLDDLAQSCSAVCFGTLAQRDAQARNTIFRFLDACRRAFRLFDVNLRGPDHAPFYDGRMLRRSCEAASAVKLNSAELPKACGLMGIHAPQAGGASYRDDLLTEALLKTFPRLEAVILTRGGEGTCLYPRAGGRIEAEVPTYPPAEDADPVGAGDACTAAILVGRVLRLPPQRIVELANHAGAFVASQPGATPDLPEAILNMARA